MASDALRQRSSEDDSVVDSTSLIESASGQHHDILSPGKDVSSSSTFEHALPMHSARAHSPEPTLLFSSSFQKRWAKSSSVFIMSSCFIAGTGFAIGHHFYYQWLSGKIVGDTEKQQWALRIGNLFAAVVATLLKIAIGSAYIQYIWLRLKQKHVSLGTIDAAFQAMDNLISLVIPELLKRMSIALIMVLVCWCIPIAQVFPPATLSVGSCDFHTEALIEASVPFLSYRAMKTNMDSENTTSLYGNNQNPTMEFRSLTNVVASTGQVLQPYIIHPDTNYTYTTGVHLPRLQCQKSTPSQFILNETSLSNWLNITQLDAVLPPKVNMTSFAYEWIESGGMYVNDSYSYPKNFTMDGQIDYLAMAGTVIEMGEGSGVNAVDDPSLLYSLLNTYTGRIYIATFTGTLNILECIAYNSSFELEVTVKQDTSTVSVKSRNDVGPVWPINLNDLKNDIKFNWPRKLYVQYWFIQLCYSILGYTVEDDLGNIGSTILAKSDEYQSLLEQKQIEEGRNVTPLSHVPGKHLSQMIEELSVNTSLSLMSDPGYCIPIKTIANYITAETVYKYKPENLLISYGVMLLCTLAIIVVGIDSFRRNGTTYDNLVSTIGASMQNVEMAEVLQNKDIGIPGYDSQVMKVRLRLGTYCKKEEDGTKSERVGFIPYSS